MQSDSAADPPGESVLEGQASQLEDRPVELLHLPEAQESHVSEV